MCVYSANTINTLNRLGEPAPYTTFKNDISILKDILSESIDELRKGTNSTIFELGIAHTAMRDIAMAASGKLLSKPVFSRYSPYYLPIACPLTKECYEAMLTARHLTTRGIHANINDELVNEQFLAAPITEWVAKIESAL
jgi:hypothetical protein